ncbi:hypothetical protein BJ170DRAFT_681118 [Xylariales sp. AK1849]|nr:hypothetical protein BJ170DRAFT_681118 [Xylariales sp. AK1849]
MSRSLPPRFVVLSLLTAAGWDVADIGRQNERLSGTQVEVLAANAFKRRSMMVIAVLGNYLYIDGGEVSQFINGREDTAVSRTRKGVTFPLDENSKQIEKGGAPDFKEPTFWPDTISSASYNWGGEGRYHNTSQSGNGHLWAFHPDGAGGGL